MQLKIRFRSDRKRLLNNPVPLLKVDIFQKTVMRKGGRRYLKKHIVLLRVGFFHFPEAKVREAGIKETNLNHFINACDYEMELNVSKRW